MFAKPVWSLSPVHLALLRLLVVLSPTVLLLGAVFHVDGETVSWVGLGAALEFILAGLLMAFYRTWAPPIGPVALTCYLVGLGWLVFWVPSTSHDWYLHLTQAILVVGPLAIVAGYTLQQSGALLVHRARKLGDELARRSNWPRELSACRELPEVKVFREAIQFDAGPALQLISHGRAEVRICALAALEFRKLWRVGQAELVLALLRREAVPEVRAAAAMALAHLDDRAMVEVLADSLRDPDVRVRRAASDALFWNTEHRWAWVRFGVRKALGDPALRHDSPMIREGQKLSAEAVHDLTAWSAEKGLVGLRASQTLVVHYSGVLHEKPDEILPQLCRTVGDPHAPPLLRIELARLLYHHKAMDAQMKEELIDQANPAPLRLLAAEGLLEGGPNVRAIVCLRELARLPNRELALSTANVVQRCLGVDLGLALGQPLPPVNSSRTLEVTRRLMAWASAPELSENVLESPVPLKSYSRMSAF